MSFDSSTIQDVQKAHSDNTTSTLTITFAVDPQPGDSIIVDYAVWTGVATHNAPTDDGGNTYTQDGTRIGTGVVSYISRWRSLNIATGGSGFKVQMNLSANAYKSLSAWLIRKSLQYNGDFAGQAQVNPGSTIASGSSSPSPPAESFFLGAMSLNSGTAADDGSGWNTEGSYGFTATLHGRARQTDFADVDLYTEYKVSSSAEDAQWTNNAGVVTSAALVSSYSEIPTEAPGSAAGTSTATAAGIALKPADGSAAGTSTATAFPATVGAGTATGTSTAAAAGSGSSSGAGAAAGSADADGVATMRASSAMTPHVLVDIALFKYPASAGVTTLRYAHRPMRTDSGFYEGRLISVSPSSRACTDPDGNYAINSVDLTFNDEDGALASMLDAGTQTEFFQGREVGVWVISQTGIAAGLTTQLVQPVFRGWVADVQRRGRRVTIRASDALGTQFSALNLDKKVLQIAVKHLTDRARDADKDKFLPIYVGEFSDRGAPDINDEDASRGLCPCIEVCEIDITTLGAPTKMMADPPVITSSSVVGTSGQKSFDYGATLVTPFGETRMSNVVTLSGASVRNLSNYNEISGTYDDGGGANKVRIWRKDSTAADFTYWLDEADYDTPGTFGYDDGAAHWPSPTRDEIDIPKQGTPPAESGADTNPNNFSVFAICLAYGYEILDIGASDLADQAEPKRAFVGASDYGTFVIRPTDPQWPFPNPWIEMNGIRFFGFLARGQRVADHRSGAVTFAANICGPHDAAGNVINQAFRAFPFLLNEFCLKNKGTGYRNHDYFTLETYANGDAIIDTYSFEDCQTQTVDWIGGLGYISNPVIDDPETTWRDVLQQFCRDFGGRVAPNRFGQTRALFVPTEADAVRGRHFREKIEIKRTEDEQLALDQIVNQLNVVYFYDPETREYRSERTPYLDDDSIAANVPGGVSGGTDLRGVFEQDRDMKFTADATTVADVAERELARRRRRPRYIPIAVGMLGYDYDIGDRGRITNSQGLGPSGDVETPVILLKIDSDPDNEEVVLTFQDLNSVWQDFAS